MIFNRRQMYTRPPNAVNANASMDPSAAELTFKNQIPLRKLRKREKTLRQRIGHKYLDLWRTWYLQGFRIGVLEGGRAIEIRVQNVQSLSTSLSQYHRMRQCSRLAIARRV
jgi:hypothetical protein